MGDVNWGRVLFLSILGFMLVMMIAIGVASAGAWDSRDPEIARAEGTVKGVNAYTVKWMKEFVVKAEALYGEERGTKAASALHELKARFAEFEVHAAALLSDVEVGVTMRPDHSKLTRLGKLNAAANAPMFELMRLMAQSGK